MASPILPARESIGKRYGRLVVLEIVSSGGLAMAACLCDCGIEKVYRLNNLRQGLTFSCGCLNRIVCANKFTKHGDAPSANQSAEYRAWAAMKTRCLNPNAAGYKDYGGRGIAICERWLSSFEHFLADLGRKPTPGHTLDRVKTDGNYEPDNCRWATRLEQANNCRRNRFLIFGGEKLTISQWGRRMGLRPNVIANRLKRGWGVKKSLTEPTGQRH